MTEAMKNMFLEGKMSDIKIKCQDQEFPCHDEATNGTMEIKDMDAQTIKKFLNYIYTDKIEEKDIDLNLIYVAHKYNVLRLISECALALTKKITNDNVLEVLKAGYLVENEDLLKASMNYMKQNNLMANMKMEWTTLKSAYPGLVGKVYLMFQ